jgi:CNT family concentrative nucleoside transporter
MGINEFVAYLHLANIVDQLSYRGIVISTYALCGFANFGSIAIQIGGIGGMAPARRSDLAKMGIKAMIAGSIAAFMTATIAGALI